MRFFTPAKNQQLPRMKNSPQIPNKKSVYLMTEKDLFGKACENYVKIGRVSGNEFGRSATNRRDEHQTGNPRKIVIQSEITTKASDSELEALSHQRLANKRIHGEWFTYSGNINPYKKIIKEINQQLESQIENEKLIEEFSSLEDNGEEIKPDSESADIYQESILLLKQIEQIKLKKAFLELKIKSFGNDSYMNIEGVCSYEISKPIKRFDSVSFKKAHPDIAEQISTQVIAPRFILKNKPRREKNEEYESLEKKCKCQKITNKSSIILSRDKDIEDLHSMWLENHVLLQPLELKRKTLEKKLKVLTGINSGLKDICNWSRKYTKKFTKSDLENYDFELAKKFLKPGKETIKFKVNNFRPYRFEEN